jgi:predicted amidohydrolase
VCATSDKEANRSKAEEFVRDAAARDAQLIVLPEVFLWRGARDEERAAAEAIPGPTTRWLGALAKELSIYLVGGSMLERIEGQARVYNTSTLFDPTGQMVGMYRKIHLFDVDIPGHVSIRESATRAAGDAPVILQTALAAFGLTICYDLRFPELYRNLARRRADIFCVPSAFTFATGALHWEILLRARAIENQAYVIAPNQIGRSPAGVQDFGHSMIVDPWGTPIAQASNGEGAIVAHIDLEYLRQVRRELPCLQHMKLDR